MDGNRSDESRRLLPRRERAARSFWFAGKYSSRLAFDAHWSHSAQVMVVRPMLSVGLSHAKPAWAATSVVCVTSVLVPSHELAKPRVTTTPSAKWAMSSYWSSSIQASSICFAGTFWVSKS